MIKSTGKMGNIYLMPNYGKLNNNTENAYMKPRYEYIGTGKPDIKDKSKKAGERQIDFKKSIENIKSRAETTKEIVYDQLLEETQKLNLKIERIEHDITHLASNLAPIYEISKKRPQTIFFH